MSLNLKWVFLSLFSFFPLIKWVSLNSIYLFKFKQAFRLRHHLNLHEAGGEKGGDKDKRKASCR